jgi:hypothetical protein
MDVTMVELPVGTPQPAGAWPVYWSAAWIGALGAVATSAVGGLLAIGFGAYPVTPGARVGPEDLGVAELVASVLVSFFAFVIGGWITARIAGIRRAETAALHGGILWLLAVPLMFLLIGFGSHAFGGWYGGLSGAPMWASPGTPVAAEAAQEAAGGAATALLLGLVGAVLGAWFGSGEPMHLGHYRRADRNAYVAP